MKLITGNSRGNSWLPAKSNSVDTRHSEGPVTQDCPSACRLVHPLALLPRRPRHAPLLLCLSWACTAPLRCCWAAWVSGDGRQGRGGQSLQLLPPFHALTLLHPSLAQRKQVKAGAASFTLSFTASFPVLLDEIKPGITSNNYFAYCSLLNLETVYFLNNYF